MQLVLLDVEGVLGLYGKIVFRPDSPTLIYGENLSGKTNIITVLRLCFLRKGLFQRKDVKLTQGEVLLDPLESGSVNCYFLQGEKMYKLTYQFSKSGGEVNEKRQLFEADAIEINWENSAEELSQDLEGATWGDPIAHTTQELAEVLEEIGVYPDLMDKLFASRNVDSYLKALKGEICEIPKALSEELMQVKEEARKNLGRLDKVEKKFLELKETAEEGLGEQPDYLEEVLPEGGLKDVTTSNVQEIKTRLDEWEEKVNERLSEGIPEDEQTTKRAQNNLEDEEPKVEAVNSAKEEILEERENFESHIQNQEELDSALEDWKEVVKELTIPTKAWNMDSAVVPATEDFDFEILENGEDVKSLFDDLGKCKEKMGKVKETAADFDFDSSENLQEEAENMGELLETLKNPNEPPEEATEVLLAPPPSSGKYPIISIPVNEYNEEMEQVNRRPRVHRKEEMTEEEEKELEKRREQLSEKVEKLSDAKEKFEEAEGIFDGIEDNRSLPEDKREELESRKEEVEEKVSDLREKFNSNASVLYNRFDREKPDLDFKPETFEDDFSEISEAVRECAKSVREEITDILDELPKSVREKFSKTEEEVREEVSSKTLSKASDELEDIIQELEEEREKQKEIQDWLQEEKPNIQESLKNLSYSNYVLTELLPYPRSLYKTAFEKVDLEKMVDELGNYIQENVEHSYRNIMPDQTLEFVHKGGGEFEPELGGQYISNPSGSQRAAISFGIMCTLASQFNLPLVMDEAADRFDSYRLSDFLAHAQKVSGEEENLQICLTVYKTEDVSDSELENANTYEVKGNSYSTKKHRTV